MSTFATGVIGGPLDGAKIDLGRAPQEGEIQMSGYHLYEFRWSVIVTPELHQSRWVYVGSLRMKAAKQD